MAIILNVVTLEVNVLKTQKNSLEPSLNHGMVEAAC